MQTSTHKAPSRLIRLPEVSRITSLSRSAIYRAEAEGKFPKRCRVGLRAVAWPESAVLAWVAARTGVES